MGGYKRREIWTKADGFGRSIMTLEQATSILYPTRCLTCGSFDTVRFELDGPPYCPHCIPEGQWYYKENLEKAFEGM